MKISTEVQPEGEFGSNDTSLLSATNTPDSAVMLSIAPLAAGEQTGPSLSKVREMAYRLYHERGCIDGHDVEDWLEAESILRQEGKLAA